MGFDAFFPPSSVGNTPPDESKAEKKYMVKDDKVRDSMIIGKNCFALLEGGSLWMIELVHLYISSTFTWSIFAK